MEGEGMGGGFHEDVDTLEEMLNGLVTHPIQIQTPFSPRQLEQRSRRPTVGLNIRPT